MSLNYELGEIANWNDLNDGTTQCMCFLSMFVGMPIIAEAGKDGWKEFAVRVGMWEAVNGPIASNGEPFPPEAVKRYVGFRSNASRLTNAQFKRQLMNQLDERTRKNLKLEDL